MEPRTNAGRPGPILTIGVPLVLVAAGGYFGWTKLIQPAIEQKAHEQTEEKLSQSTSVNEKKYGKRIKVAGDPWSGYSTFRNERRLANTLAKNGIGVEYVDDEKLYEQGARMEALATGKIDLALTTVDAFLQHGAKFKKDGLYPGVILWNVDESSGGDAIFLSKGRKGFDSVKPSDKVCFASGTPSEHLWDFVSLSFSNLGDRLPTDNGVVAADCWKKLRADQVQVAVLWQPFTAIAVKEGYPKVFATGGQADDVIIDVVVANRDYVIREKETLKALAQAYFDVIDGYVKEPDEHAKFITSDCGADCAGDATLGRAVLDGIDFLTYEENMCLWWGHCGGANKMIERVGKTGKLLSAKGKLKPTDQPEPRTVLNDSFLTGLKGDLEQRAKLAREVAGKDTAVVAPVLEAKEKVYAYAPSDAKNEADSDVGTLSLPSVYFPEGKATLDPNARSVVSSIGDKLKSFPALCVRVHGHTNSSGNPENNKRLSAARAKAIVDELRATDANAFPEARFDARGFGSERPVLKDGREDLDSSRRTEFKLFNCGSKAVTSAR